MSFFKNKHVITAMIVAPILAIASYYFVDLMVKEQPHVAIAGHSYELLAKPNCRYTSGECDLVNASFQSTLRVTQQGGQQILTLNASHPLSGVTIGFVEQGEQRSPETMQAQPDNRRVWSLPILVNTDEHTQLRVAMTANGASYFAETTLAFAEYRTSFDKKF